MTYDLVKPEVLPGVFNSVFTHVCVVYQGHVHS